MRLNRRIFLRGVGGAVVAAPFLTSILERKPKGQTISAPRQLIWMFTHYGCDTNKFFPVKSHGALVADDLAPTSLAVLAPLLGKLLIPRGIRAMNEWTMNNDGTNGLGQGNDLHLNVCGSYFTSLFMRVGNSGGATGEAPQSAISYLKAAGADPAAPADTYRGSARRCRCSTC